MKTNRLAAALCAALLWPALPPLQAQDTAAEAAPTADRPERAALDRDEARRLAAAREQARNDPTVRSLMAARESVDQQIENAMHAAMLAADPSLGPSLQQVQQSRDRAKGMRDRFQELPAEQRQQLQQARQSAQKDPAVVAARERIKAAESPEERREAGRAMRQAMRDAMVRENPALESVIDEIASRRGPAGRPGGRGGPGGGPGGPSGPKGPDRQ